MFKMIMMSFVFISVAFSESNYPIVAGCVAQADKFGNGEGKDEISRVCVDIFKEHALSLKSKSKESSDRIIFGHKNMLFVQDKFDFSKIEVFAGKSTLLHDIVAIEVDEIRSEIIVLESRGDVLFFSTRLSGNVAPRRVLKHSETLGASDLYLNPWKHEILVLNKSKNKIVTFPGSANVHGFEGKQNLKVLHVVRGIDASFEKIQENVSRKVLVHKDNGLAVTK